MTDYEFGIAICLPTRARTHMMDRSVCSLFDLADNPQRIKILFGFDNNDSVGTDYFTNQLQPWLDAKDHAYTAMQFEPMGYIRLNEYVNAMTKTVTAKWYIVWNDDAVMRTVGWDTEVMRYDGKFKLLAFHTHQDHPYSIFPIVPHKWIEILGYLSPHQISDAWLSQQAYMLDIWQRIDVMVKHDRYDLTGNNNDTVFQNRPMLEGHPFTPGDFDHIDTANVRLQDCAKLANYMKSIGLSTVFFENVLAGRQDAWEKLAKNDVNQQQGQFSIDLKNKRVTKVI
jgi:hypothetical protein